MQTNKRTTGRPRKLGPLEELIVYNEYRKGVSITEIAYQNNVSVSTVHRTVRSFKEKSQKEERE